MPTAVATDEWPLVSIVVRSMGRPELRMALDSLSRQDYHALEVIVVDATGGRHPPLPRLGWRNGHTLRLVTHRERLPRPAAASVGLQSVRGEWFSFLDDDDTCAADHVSTLVDGARAHPDALVVYGKGRLLDSDGRVQKVFGRPFNRALMHYGPLFYWQAALIRTRVRELGCRFDPEMLVCEDRDFLAQIAQRGPFAFLPAASTFHYRPHLGTSGTGSGTNRDVARVARFENLLRAKWAGCGTLHNERAASRCRQGVRAYLGGDVERARASFDEALADYPDDPNALHGLARVALAFGRPDDAERYARAALDVNPHAAEYHATFAEIGIARGARPAMTSPPTMSVPPAMANAPARLAPCPCGSGRRFKACCGRLGESQAPAAIATVDPWLVRARRDLARGDADAARARLRDATASPDASRERILAAARVELDFDAPSSAFALLERAAATKADAEVGLLLEDCCARLARRERDASLGAAIADMVRASKRHGDGGGARDVRIVVAAADARRLACAQRLQASLGPDAHVTALDGAGSAPPIAPGATYVLLDPALDWDAPRTHEHVRWVVRMERDDPEMLLRALVRLEERFPRATLTFTRPFDGAFADAACAMPVEYPWIDAALFQRALPHEAAKRLVVGRAGPPEPLDDHPNDPALYRRLMAEGHRVAVPGTPFLRAAFEDDPPALRPAFDDRAAGLPDIMLCRGRPGSRGLPDARILAAMAAATPVVAFASCLGAREWIEHEGNGFLVHGEDEAMRCIALLAANPARRREIARSARDTAMMIARAQRERVGAFYLGVSVIE